MLAPRLTPTRSIREQQLGAVHPDTAVSLWSLAGLYYQMNRVAEAKPMITRAVEIRDRTLGFVPRCSGSLVK